ncbi:MAG: DNA-binding HxlR family transcriptional regulator [Candidatus Azotimanducaceae bacterium]|jgi:DNA-binding HxlR family transcriptional regulator
MGFHRFDEFQKDLCIVRNILSGRLERLVSEGILEKVKGGSGYFEYRLNEKGGEPQPILPNDKRLTFWIERRETDQTNGGACERWANVEF